MKLGEFFERVARRYFDIKRDGYAVVDAVADVLEEEGHVVLSREYYDTLVETGTLPEED